MTQSKNDLGALFANEGVWNGRRVVSESWVLATRESPVAFGTDGYGHLWWKRTFTLGNEQLESAFTSGNGGNHIFVVPSREVVVAFTGSNYNSVRSDTPQQLMPRVLRALR